MRRIVIINAKVVKIDGSFCSNGYYALEVTFTMHGDGQDGKEAKAILKFSASNYGTVNNCLYANDTSSFIGDDDTPFMKEVFEHLAGKIDDQEDATDPILLEDNL